MYRSAALAASEHFGVSKLCSPVDLRSHTSDSETKTTCRMEHGRDARARARSCGRPTQTQPSAPFTTISHASRLLPTAHQDLCLSSVPMVSSSDSDASTRQHCTLNNPNCAARCKWGLCNRCVLPSASNKIFYITGEAD
jgi:hypothetical protein